MLKLRNEETALTSRPMNTSESGMKFLFLIRKIEIKYEIDAISINSDNAIQSSQVGNVQSTRQRNPSVSSSCPSVNQDIPNRPKG
jgi:hypothetical protein